MERTPNREEKTGLLLSVGGLSKLTGGGVKNAAVPAHPFFSFTVAAANNVRLGATTDLLWLRQPSWARPPPSASPWICGHRILFPPYFITC